MTGEWQLLLLFGVVAGWAAGFIVGERSFGVIGSLVIGLLGAVVGGFVLRHSGLQVDNNDTSVAFGTALIGSLMLLMLVKLLRRV
jgi:uncharacterized membrane protein YeaQ/YmgE (transglycosylase-associated protein family)